MGTSNVYSTFDPSSLFAGAFPTRQRPITLASGSNTAGTPLPRGALLGRVTASGKYIPCKATATDGSQNPTAVLAADTDAGSADAETAAYFEGEFAFQLMTIDVSWTLSALGAALAQAPSPLYVRSVEVLG